MTNHLKVFNTRSEYEAFTGTSEFVTPNVSWCKEAKNIVYYNPYVKATGVTLDKHTLSISEGSTDTLVATVLPANASDKSVIWSSSDESIVTVSDNGVVSGVSMGNANITVTTERGGFTDICNLSVNNYNVITYAATSKLSETTSTGTTVGLHTNSFSGTNSQQLTMVSHKFSNGVGKITFNDSIVSIGDYAFYYCSSMTSVGIPNSVTSIGNDAFNRCSSLTSVTIGSGVTSIGSQAFRDCYGLTSIDIPSGVTTISGYIFTECRSLSSVTIGDGVTSIGKQAFYHCSGLTRLNSSTDGVFNIPDSVTSIDSNAFTYCSSLTSCTIGSGVTTIGGGVFYGCYNLRRLNSNADGVFNIPSGVTTIGNDVFAYCSSLTSVNIHNSVTRIGESSFQHCTGLTSIDIPSGVTTIGNSAFSACTSLTSVTIPNSVKSIDYNAFYTCTSLTSITSNAVTAPTIQISTFRNVKTGGTLYVPIGSSGYNVWMSTADYYLGKYGWTKVEQ